MQERTVIGHFEADTVVLLFTVQKFCQMQVAGQFQNMETAKCYARIRSYIETCYRNGINVVYAIKCLCDGTLPSLTQISTLKTQTCEKSASLVCLFGLP